MNEKECERERVNEKERERETVKVIESINARKILARRLALIQRVF